MLVRQYRFKFYLNARHAMRAANAKVHPHTWEIVLHVVKKSDAFIQFSSIEKDIQKFLSQYEGTFLNEMPAFILIEPTAENIGEKFYKEVNKILISKGWVLNSLEISENPTRTYIISDLQDIIDIGENHTDALPGVVHSLQVSTTASEEAAAVSENATQKEEKIEKGTVEVKAAAESNESIEEIKPKEDSVTENNALTESSIIEENKDKHVSANDLINPKKENGTAANNKKLLLAGFLALVYLAGTVIFIITITGLYPWGSDSWYHIFKGHFLYKEILKGNLYPLYCDLWYNGVEPLRYWAPLPHYILALFEFMTGGNSANAYNLFIFVVFIAGGTGWLIWGIKSGRFKLSVALALLWFFLPDNLRVLFSEGNVARVVVTTIFPYLLLCIYSYLQYKKTGSLVGIFFIMTGIVLCHAMIAAMVGVTIFLFVVFYGIFNNSLKKAFTIVISALLGICFSGIWLLPALKGGLVSMDRDAVQELMKGMTYSITTSLNPVLHLSSVDSFYFGISIFLIILIGTLFADKKTKAPFLVAFIIFIGTTKIFISILAKIPMSQVFWMMRFTPLAMGLLFAGMILWKNLNKRLIYIVIIAIAIDSGMSFYALGHNATEPPNIKATLDIAIEETSSRVALFDESKFGSYPSYYLAYNPSNKNVKQVFGSGWQGAKTSNNIVWLNTSFEKGFYSYMFDRCMEYGADVVIVKKDEIKDHKGFLKTANNFNYHLVKEDALCMTFKLPVDYPFATKVQYQGLAIGRYAENLTLIFPQFSAGRSDYLDDYTEKELSEYKVVFLSGFKFHDQARSEQLVKTLSNKGIKFVIDLTGVEGDIFSTRANFMGVISQPIKFNGKYPALSYKGEKYEFEGFPEEYKEWSTIYLENLPGIQGTLEVGNQTYAYLGKGENDNIAFIGLNLPFYSVQTMNSNSIHILEDVLGIEADKVPIRKIVKLDTSVAGNVLKINASEKDVITGIARLDSFRTVSGETGTEHDLLYAGTNQVDIKFVYPYFYQGLLISLAGITLFLILIISLSRKERLSVKINIEGGKKYGV